MERRRIFGRALNLTFVASLTFSAGEKSSADYFVERYGEIKASDYWCVYRGLVQTRYGAYIEGLPIIEGDEIGAFVENSFVGYYVKGRGEIPGDFDFYVYAPDPDAFQSVTPEFRIYSVRGVREFPSGITLGKGAWGNFGWRDIRLDAVIPSAGDINYDGRVDGADISLFVSALLSPCNIGFREFSAADMNADGNVNSLDVPLFVSRLSRG